MSVALSWCWLVYILGLLKIDFLDCFFVAFVYCSLDRFIINLLFHLSISFLAFLNSLLLSLTLTPRWVWMKTAFQYNE